MPGGPVNGSGVYGPDALKNNPVATVIVPTMLQIAADEVDAFTHLTCLYDRYWYNRADMMTFPIAFFYVKEMHEIRQTDISEQRIIMYEPQMSNQDAIKQKTADPLRPGVMEVVVDNTVTHPKSYTLDIIVPFQPVSKQFVRTVQEFKQIMDSFVEIFSNNHKAQTDLIDFENIFSAAGLFLQSGEKMVDIVAKFPKSNAANYINKNSLEAMQEGGKTLTMKMWTGYDYKYVAITGLDFSKKGLEDDVFRATMQVKEVPVLSVTPVRASTPSGIDRNWAATAVSQMNNLLLALPMALTQVKEHSGEQAGHVSIDGTGVTIG